ncbi:MAG TPA: hypothetical protein VK135_00905 [Candidatus Dormibacteraeota bacterium]|nr:hypothetical protein [Candidatus Dormibacteraeota bacterium]
MNNMFEENRSTFLMLVGLMFVLLMVLYFAFISPLLSDLKEKKSSQVDLQNDIAVLEKKLQQLDESEEEFEQEQLELQKKIPLTRELEEIVLILQEIELHSSSVIEEINFYYDGSLPTSDFIHELDTEEMVEDEDGSEGEKGENNDEKSPTIDLVEKPERLQLITLNMEITSPTYDDFLQLVTEIEQQERIMGVSKVQFETQSESVDVETDGSIEAEVELITFFYQE